MLTPYLRRFYLPLFCAVALTVYIAQHYTLSLPELANNYLNDLLCMPIVLKICQYTVRFIKRDTYLKIPIKISFSLTVFYAIYFELILPQFYSRYTADGIDVILYFLGLLFFLWVERENPKGNRAGF